MKANKISSVCCLSNTLFVYSGPQWLCWPLRIMEIFNNNCVSASLMIRRLGDTVLTSEMTGMWFTRPAVRWAGGRTGLLWLLIFSLVALPPSSPPHTPSGLYPGGDHRWDGDGQTDWNYTEIFAVPRQTLMLICETVGPPPAGVSLLGLKLTPLAGKTRDTHNPRCHSVRSQKFPK